MASVGKVLQGGDGALFALGFRPFFLVAGIWAALALPLWLAALWGWVPVAPYYPGTAWHVHSLSFGYVLAVVAGFLLTAARNWSGIPTATGWALAGLVALWAAGRAAPWLALPGPAIALVDLAFPLALALGARRALWGSPNAVNRVFLALLGGFALGVGLVHWGIQTGSPRLWGIGERLVLDLVVGILVLVSGRVMPFFTRAAVAGAAPRTWPRLEAAIFSIWGGWALADVVAPGTPVGGGLGLGLAALLGVRLWGWHHPAVWRLPMLWVLYLGLMWLIVGLGLYGIAQWGLVSMPPARHGVTVGAIGVLTLGMMARVTLGHTGRAVEAGRLTILAFVAINLAASVRVAGPILVPGGYAIWLGVSGVLWFSAFALFLWVYGPMLVRARVDGRPG